MSLSPVAEAYLSALLRGDPRAARVIVDTALADGMRLQELYLDVFQQALYEVGRRWQDGEATVAQEHLATATTQTLAARLSSWLTAVPESGRTAVVTGTEGELHALGPRFVGDFLEGEGWTVLDLGASTPSADLVRAVVEHRPELVCLSTTLPTNLTQAQAAVAGLRRLPDRPLIAVGGGAYRRDPAIARDIGADVHAADAAEFLEVIGGR